MARLRGWLRGHLKLVVMSAIAGLGVSAGLAIATVPDNGGVIHTCYQKAAGGGTVPLASPGNWRVIDPEPPASQSCDPASELPLSFNQQGPVGVPGAAGAAGAPGMPGTSGAGGGGECSTVVGHMTLSGSPTLASDLCGVLQVRIGTRASTGAGGTGPATEYELTRRSDGLSPKLFKATTQGTIFKPATIQVYKPGTTTVAATYKLANATISSFKAGLGLEQPDETLTLAAVPKKGS